MELLIHNKEIQLDFLDSDYGGFVVNLDFVVFCCLLLVMVGERSVRVGVWRRWFQCLLDVSGFMVTYTEAYM